MRYLFLNKRLSELPVEKKKIGIDEKGGRGAPWTTFGLRAQKKRDTGVKGESENGRMSL